MGRYVLNVIYLSLITLALPVLLYRRFTKGKYRGGWGEKLFGRVPKRRGNQPCLWLHAVSVGEVLQLQPIIEGWKASHPDWEIYVTTTTGTGREVAERSYPDCTVCYCPLDFTWAVGAALRRIRPNCVGLVELELWPNLITTADRRNVPLVLLNGRLSAKSFRGYRKIRPLVRNLLQRFELIAVQNDEYAQRFRQLGADLDQLLVAGSIKFDRLQTDRNTSAIQDLRQSLGLPKAKPVFMAGSTHAPEEEIALRVWQKLREDWPDLQLIIAPRHAERFDEVAGLIQKTGQPFVRRSSGQTEADAAIYLLDTLGELSACWGLAHFAYVGGSLNQRGGQNMMEPAAYGSSVLFGPNTWNFAEVVSSLKEEQACREVKDEQELEAALRELLSNLQQAREMGLNAQEYVLSQQGATRRTLAELQVILDEGSEQSPRLAA